MPFTYSGRNVMPEWTEHPSLTDIAISLSRMPRFAGHTRRWWSVLDHTLLGLKVLEARAAERPLKLAWLLHDAHESITGDIPTPVKTPELRRKQDQLDQLIYGAFASGLGADWWHEAVKALDRECMIAEAHIIGPQVPEGRLNEAFGYRSWASEAARILEQNLIYPGGILGLLPRVTQQETHPAVVAYVTAMLEVM